jgi:hypothetical protein
VGSSEVVVVHLLLHDAMDMPFAQDDEVVQAFASKTAQEAFDEMMESWSHSLPFGIGSGSCDCSALEDVIGYF